MSEPKIWTIKMPDNTLSKWVKHSDYARLQAEVERLNELVNNPYRLSKGWRPIETAPMDGTEVLLACVGHDNLKIGVKMHKEDTGSDLLNSCYVIVSSGAACQPTHWMPLPKPPAV